MSQMKEQLKEILAILFRYCGIPYFLRKTVFRNRVTVALYHNPPADVFEEHILYLKKYFNIIPLDALVSAIHRKDWSDIPPYSLVITIDDGFKENYLLLDAIKKHGIQPTIYLSSHLMDTKRKLWFDCGFSDFQGLKKYDVNKSLEILKEKVGFTVDKEYCDRQTLNNNEIEEMAPYVDFQSHSRFHYILINCDEKCSKKEIVESKETLEKALKQPISHFSYPNGDYGNREIGYLKDSGYKSGRSCDLGWNGVNTNPYKLKAMGIQDDATINILWMQICGLFGYIRFLRNGSYNGKQPTYL